MSSEEYSNRYFHANYALFTEEYEASNLCQSLKFNKPSGFIIYYTNNYDDVFQYKKDNKTHIILGAKKILIERDLEQILREEIDIETHPNFPYVWAIRKKAESLLKACYETGQLVTPEVAHAMKEQIKRKHKNDKYEMIRRRGHKCEMCKGQFWQEMPIPLELHHINSNPHDNTESNLQLLCIHCHKLVTWRNRKDLENE